MNFLKGVKDRDEGSEALKPIRFVLHFLRYTGRFKKLLTEKTGIKF